MATRRELLLGGVSAATVAAFESVTPKAAEAAGIPVNWPDHFWHYTEPGGKEGESTEIVMRPITTYEGQTVVIHTGDVRFTDSAGKVVEYNSGEKGGSISIVLGPAGADKGGKDVWLGYRKKYASLKVTNNPSGTNLDAAHTARLINTQLKSFRENKVNGEIFVQVIDGKTGRLKERRFIPEDQLAVE